MSGRPSRKSAEIGLFRPFSAFFALFRRVRRAPGKSRKRRKKAFFLRYPRICLNPHLLNPHLRHSKQYKVESRKIDSESPIRIETYQCFVVSLESHDSSRIIQIARFSIRNRRFSATKKASKDRAFDESIPKIVPRRFF